MLSLNCPCLVTAPKGGINCVVIWCFQPSLLKTFPEPVRRLTNDDLNQIAHFAGVQRLPKFALCHAPQLSLPHIHIKPEGLNFCVKTVIFIVINHHPALGFLRHTFFQNCIANDICIVDGFLIGKLFRLVIHIAAPLVNAVCSDNHRHVKV